MPSIFNRHLKQHGMACERIQTALTKITVPQCAKKMGTDSTDSRTQFSLLMLLILDRLQNSSNTERERESEREREREREEKNRQLLSQMRIKPIIKLK